MTKFRKPLTYVMLALAISIAILLPFVRLNQAGSPPSVNSVLFVPGKYPEGDWTPDNLRFEDIYFVAEDNTRLHGWYCPAENPVATILIAHGNAGHVASRAPLLRHLQASTRASVFIFDYRGYGRSDGKPTVDGALQDARAARAKLRELASIKDSEMILMGDSLGGAIAVQLAAESPPRALILQSTFSSLHDLAEMHYPQFASMVPATMLDSVSAIGQYCGELFQSHGENDRTIPIELGQRLFQAANNPKMFEIIPGADHNSWLTREYFRRLDKFIRSVSTTER